MDLYISTKFSASSVRRREGDVRQFFACTIDSVEYESCDGRGWDREDSQSRDELKWYCRDVDEEKELETVDEGCQLGSPRIKPSWVSMGTYCRLRIKGIGAVTIYS